MTVIIDEVEMEVAETAPRRGREAPAEAPRPRPDPVQILALIRRAESRRDRLGCD